MSCLTSVCILCPTAKDYAVRETHGTLRTEALMLCLCHQSSYPYQPLSSLSDIHPHAVAIPCKPLWPNVQVLIAQAHIYVDALLQAKLGVPAGTIKATVLIETLPAAFEMDEILYELRQHSSGLNCGRWDYIFSFIKTMRADPSYIMPDRCAL